MVSFFSPQYSLLFLPRLTLLPFSALILFDLGALELQHNLKKIILVTRDKFSLNAEACFNNDCLHKDHDGNMLLDGEMVFAVRERERSSSFVRVESCIESVRIVNRLLPR